MAGVVNEFLMRSFREHKAGKRLTVVLGNEGGDMDSIVGSIYLAFYLEQHKDLGDKTYVPVLNFDKADLPLRGDVVQLFSRYGITTDWLLSTTGTPGMECFLDLKENLPDVVLYDHNKLNPLQTFLEKVVVGVIDHHFDDKLYLNQTKSFRRIETVGSACTLVAELFKAAELAVPCAEVLLAPIILDTVNFDPLKKKVSDKDIQVSKWLVEKTGKSINISKMFFELSSWKKDILGLTFLQHFRRDYKAFDIPLKGNKKKSVQIGISSIACRYDQLLGSHGISALLSNCLEFIVLRKLKALILACFGEMDCGKNSRQVVFIAEGVFFDVLVSYARSSPENVEFIPIETEKCDGWSLISYELSDPSVSRKKLAPSLLRFCSSSLKL